MILTGILYIAYAFVYVISAPLRLLADVSLPAGVAQAVATASNNLAIVDTIAPVTALLAVISAFLVVEGGIFVYRLIIWVIKKLPLGMK